jgi:uncharacterized protein (TIGR01370 family)
MRWAVYYGDEARPEEFRDYGLIVLDSDHHPPIESLVARGATVLGYVSVGEINQHRAGFAAVKQMGVLLAENPNWSGSYYIDVRDPRWQSVVIDEVVPKLLAQGFQGVFLDTLDDPVELERRDPRGCKGMAGAAVALVKALRRKFPSAILMMNRGYGLLPDLAGQIDIELGESVYGGYDFERKAYRRVSAAEYQQQVQWLKQAKKWNPTLRVCSLDYWDPADRDGIRRIYRVERSNGFAPYVATIGLDQLVKEPR